MSERHCKEHQSYEADRGGYQCNPGIECDECRREIHIKELGKAWGEVKSLRSSLKQTQDALAESEKDVVKEIDFCLEIINARNETITRKKAAEDRAEKAESERDQLAEVLVMALSKVRGLICASRSAGSFRPMGLDDLCLELAETLNPANYASILEARDHKKWMGFWKLLYRYIKNNRPKGFNIFTFRRFVDVLEKWAEGESTHYDRETEAEKGERG